MNQNSKKTPSKQQRPQNFLNPLGAAPDFQKKHLPELSSRELETQLENIIKNNRASIKKALFKQCGEILSDAITLKLEPALNKKNILLTTSKLKVCNIRKNTVNKSNCGWPNYCIFLSWTDDGGEFQEFIYPLQFNASEKQFRIPADEIVTQFIRYRDTLV